jgi:hypothetical protein
MLKRNKRPCAECPCDRTSANSRLNLMRTDRGNPSRLGFGVPGVGDLDTLGQQAFATALATAAQDRAATLRFHSSAKTELALTRALAWLVGAFHKSEKWSPLEYPFDPRSQSRNPDRRDSPRRGKAPERKSYLHSGTLAPEDLDAATKFDKVLPTELQVRISLLDRAQR